MNKKKRKILVTAALPYANGELHMGHLTEYLQADFWVRYQRMHGHECLYFSADDAHGTPIMLSAKKRGLSSEALITEQKKLHEQDFAGFLINFTHFSSTHSQKNREFCEKIFHAMQEGGHISEKRIRQSYCENCNMFLPDRLIRGTCPYCKTKDQYGDVCESCSRTYSPSELLDPSCATCGHIPVMKESDHLFFELSHFEDFLKDWINKRIPEEITHQFKEWFQERLKAWNISRDTPYFGFPIPNFPEKYFYVWMDAPIGYIACSQEWLAQQGRSYEEFWKSEDSELYHFIGKDIVYFHALFWPATLKAAGLRTPTKLFVHGFLTLNGQKMSKSRGHSISAPGYLQSGIPPEYLRYYFAGKLSPKIIDFDLNLEEFKNRINAELVGKISNLASRSISMLHKRCLGIVGSCDADGKALLGNALSQSEACMEYYEAREFHKVSSSMRKTAENANRYFDEKSPWGIEDPESCQAVLSAAIEVFRIIVITLAPIMPFYAQHASYILSETETNTPSLSTSGYIWSDLQQRLTGKKLRNYTHLAKRLSSEEVGSLLK